MPRGTGLSRPPAVHPVLTLDPRRTSLDLNPTGWAGCAAGDVWASGTFSTLPTEAMLEAGGDVAHLLLSPSFPAARRASGRGYHPGLAEQPAPAGG